MKRKYLFVATFLLLGAGCMALAKQYKSQPSVPLFGAGATRNITPLPKGWYDADKRSDLIDQQGQVALDHKRYQEAEGLFRKALLVQPHNSEAWLLLVEACERQGKLEEALPAYHTIVYATNGTHSSIGEDPVTRMRYVLALVRSNRYADAVQVYDKAQQDTMSNGYAVKLFPLRFDANISDENRLQAAAHYVMGLEQPHHREVGLGELRQHLEAAIRFAPDWGKPHAALGKMLEWHRHEQEAEVEYTKSRNLGEPVESYKQASVRTFAKMKREHDLAHPELHATNGVSIPLKFSDAQIKQWIANSQTDMSKNEQLLKEIKKANAAQTATSQAQPKL